jgi:hypothetical protein
MRVGVELWAQPCDIEVDTHLRNLHVPWSRTSNQESSSRYGLIYFRRWKETDRIEPKFIYSFEQSSASIEDQRDIIPQPIQPLQASTGSKSQV